MTCSFDENFLRLFVGSDFGIYEECVVKHEILFLEMRGDTPSFQFGKIPFVVSFCVASKIKKREESLRSRNLLDLQGRHFLILLINFCCTFFGLPTLVTYLTIPIYLFLFTPCVIFFGLIAVRNASLWRCEAYLLGADG